VFGAVLALAMLGSGCGGPTRTVFHAGDESPSAPVPVGAAAVSPSATGTPGPAGSRTPSPPASRRPAASSRPGYSPAPLSLLLADASPMGGRQITAIYQDMCGDPSRGVVYVDVSDPARISEVWFEYHVRTPVPFDGANRGLSVSGDFRGWRGGIGPFAADPHNADGGPITVTAHGVYRDGSERTATATWTLMPCHH
jgi:hypothetical protein